VTSLRILRQSIKHDCAWIRVSQRTVKGGPTLICSWIAASGPCAGRHKSNERDRKPLDRKFSQLRRPGRRTSMCTMHAKSWHLVSTSILFTRSSALQKSIGRELLRVKGWSTRPCMHICMQVEVERSRCILQHIEYWAASARSGILVPRSVSSGLSAGEDVSWCSL
jgi:hypothetical protein